LRDWHAFVDEQKRLENALKWKERKQRVRQWLSHIVPLKMITMMERQASSPRNSQATNSLIQQTGSDSGRELPEVSRAAWSSLTLVNPVEA